MYYCYILQSCLHNELYIGSTEDLKTRLSSHNQGKVTATKSGRPWTVIYYEAHRSKHLARVAELFYKTSQGRRQLKKEISA